MQQLPKQLWEECLRLIRNNIREEQFATWFAPLELVQYDKSTNELVVSVPSPFVYEYIEENFVDLLSKVLRRQFGKGVKLSYHVLTDKSHELNTVMPSEGSQNGLSAGPMALVGNMSPTMLCHRML